MLGKYAVKKPYTVIVGVILVLILGVISFTHMTTDLLPNMNFPYVIVYTTYVGATPEQVEDEVTRPMEAAFATLTDIKDVSSQSSDNLSLVVLEFNDTADMNTAMIEINSEITTLSATWSDSIGAPAIMKINPDMLPVSIVSVVRDDMDILELSRYVEEELVPQYEAINGVASVTASGVITQEVDVTFTGSWYDETLEKEGAEKLIQGGCKLISQHADSLGAPTACENAGVPNVSYNGSTKDACPNTFIVSSRIDWAPYYEMCIKAVMDGTEIPADWTGTLATGSVVLTDVNETAAAAGTAEAIAAATEKLEKGEIHVFDCSTFTVKGETLTSYQADVNADSDNTPDTEVVHDGYFSESEFRSAPYFDLEIDGITRLDVNFG